MTPKLRKAGGSGRPRAPLYGWFLALALALTAPPWTGAQATPPGQDRLPAASAPAVPSEGPAYEAELVPPVPRPIQAAPKTAEAAETGAQSPATPAPAPAPVLPELTLDIGAEGGIAVAGTLPAGLSRAQLRRIFADARIAEGLEPSDTGDAAGWADALEALNVILPRLGPARVRVAPGQLTLTGRLQRGFSLRETHPALRAALPPEWAMDFQVEEVPPAATLRFRQDADGITLDGLLPAGITPAQAAAVLGGTTTGALTGGASTEGGDWARVLTTLGTLLKLFETVEGTIAPGTLTLAGRLHPGQDGKTLRHWLERELGAAWAVSIEAETTAAAPDAERLDPATRRIERLTNGHWVPVYAFPPGAEACARATDLVQAETPLTFVTGAARVSDEAAAVLDRLAGIAIHCLRGTDLRLEIGGHTDAVGDPEENRALSRNRSLAVLIELATRGAPPAAMHATGYGAERPIADNDTIAGRAENRRISLDWTHTNPAK
jgi:OOP family OmpA-OmpF porin